MVLPFFSIFVNILRISNFVDSPQLQSEDDQNILPAHYISSLTDQVSTKLKKPKNGKNRNGGKLGNTVFSLFLDFERGCDSGRLYHRTNPPTNIHEIKSNFTKQTTSF
jgi:hypothetical protein